MPLKQGSIWQSSIPGKLCLCIKLMSMVENLPANLSSMSGNGSQSRRQHKFIRFNMQKLYFENKTFEHVDFSFNILEVADYEQCTFIRCDFTEAVLNNLSFIECTFTGCNLSNAKIESAAFRDAK